MLQTMTLTRRTLLVSGLAATASFSAGAALSRERPIDLTWSDLVPGEDGTLLEALRQQGVVQHGQLSTPFDQETAGLVTDEYDGKMVRIPGYLLPLDFEGTSVTTALLVPYVGACLHVPPPPPNQLIFVTAGEPYEMRGIFEPVFVTGRFGAAATDTALAEIGYAISDGDIKPYTAPRPEPSDNR